MNQLVEPGVIGEGSQAASAAPGPPPRPLQLTATREHLHQLVLARNTVLAALLAYAGLQLAFGGEFLSPWEAALFVLAVAFNFGTLVRLRLPAAVSHHEFLLQILADVALLGAALHDTGGDSSPLGMLNLVPLTIAAATLPWRHTLVVFLAVVLAHEVICVVLPNGAWFAAVDRSGDLVDALAAGLIVLFVSGMARSSARHGDLLRKLREKYLGQRHAADLGTLAAHAAHQLSTPLATIAVLVGDMRAGGMRRPDDIQRALEVMATEIQACKEVSSRLLASAGYARAEGGGRMTADRFLARIVDRCQLMQPWVSLHCRHEGTTPVPEIVAESSLEHALAALLNTAPGRARRVEVVQSWSEHRLSIHICRGSPRGALSSAEELDAVMAKHTIGWLGGSVRDVSAPDGCSRIEIALPLRALSAPRNDRAG